MTEAIHVLAFLLAHCTPSEGDAGQVAFLEDLAREVAYVAAEAPIFHDELGVRRTALLMASVMSLESSCRQDVASGAVRGDQGRAIGPMQVHLRPGEQGLCDTRLGCLRVGRERVRESLYHCRGNEPGDRLALFMSGSCKLGRRPARARWERFKAWRMLDD